MVNDSAPSFLAQNLRSLTMSVSNFLTTVFPMMSLWTSCQSVADQPIFSGSSYIAVFHFARAVANSAHYERISSSPTISMALRTP